MLSQRAEVYLLKKSSKKEVASVSPGPGVKPKKANTRLKPLSPKLQKDETLEVGIIINCALIKIYQHKYKKNFF